MRQAVQAASQNAAIAGTGAVITLSDISTFVTIAVGVATLVFIGVQTVVLLWKFYHMRKEKAAGKPLPDSGPGSLSG